MTSRRPDPFDTPFFREHNERFAQMDRQIDKAPGRIFTLAYIATAVTMLFYLACLALVLLGVVWLWGQVR